jgi:hypothetical protein
MVEGPRCASDAVMFVSRPYEQSGRNREGVFARGVYKTVTFTEGYAGPMRTLTSPRIAALALASVALLGITGCSGSPTASGSNSPSSSSPANDETSDGGTQTTEEACTLVQETMAEATAEFEQLNAEDPAAAVEAMEAAAQSLSDLSGEITNEEVAALVPSLQSMFEQVADVMKAIVAGETDRLGEMQELGTQFQETTTQFQELCAPAE